MYVHNVVRPWCKQVCNGRLGSFICWRNPIEPTACFYILFLFSVLLLQSNKCKRKIPQHQQYIVKCSSLETIYCLPPPAPISVAASMSQQSGVPPNWRWQIQVKVALGSAHPTQYVSLHQHSTSTLNTNNYIVSRVCRKCIKNVSKYARHRILIFQ